ncbi:hypothetical protein LINPERHAP1_LOCUS28859, partial [Linum perenne]
LLWNCRGVGSYSFSSALNFYLQAHKPQIVAILEPRTSGAKGLFVRNIVVEAQGFRGGIWLLWNEVDFSIQIIKSSNQFIHIRPYWHSGKSCFITFIYASPHLHCRRTLWQDLFNLWQTTSDAWMILGDFNAMVDALEKLGGTCDEL